MISALFVHFVPPRFRVPFFTLNVVLGLVALVVSGGLLASFWNSDYTLLLILFFASAVTGTLLHACMLIGVCTGNRRLFLAADSVLFVATLAVIVSFVVAHAYAPEKPQGVRVLESGSSRLDSPGSRVEVAKCCSV